MKSSIDNCTKEKEDNIESFDKNFEKDLILIAERNECMAEFVAELSEEQYKKFEKFLIADEKMHRSVLRNTLATFLKNKR